MAARNGQKQPYYIHRHDEGVLAFAGFWEHEGQSIYSTTAITMDADDKIRDIHDRMPVILPQSNFEDWLDTDWHEPENLRSLLVSESGPLEYYPISTEVNSTIHQGAMLTEPVDP